MEDKIKEFQLIDAKPARETHIKPDKSIDDFSYLQSTVPLYWINPGTKLDISFPVYHALSKFNSCCDEPHYIFAHVKGTDHLSLNYS